MICKPNFLTLWARCSKGGGLVRITFIMPLMYCHCVTVALVVVQADVMGCICWLYLLTRA